MSEVLGRVVEQKNLFEGIVFNVDEFQIEVGKQERFGDVVIHNKVGVITRQLVTKRPCVVGLVKHTGKDKFIVTKEFRVGSMREEYGFVAGIIDDGETSWDAIVRELKEETGYKPTMVKQLGESFSSSGFTNEHITYFYIEVNEEGKVGQNLDDDEIVIVEFMKMEEILRKIKHGEINGNHAKSAILHYLLDKSSV